MLQLQQVAAGGCTNTKHHLFHYPCSQRPYSSSSSSKVCFVPVLATMAPSFAAFFSSLRPPFLPCLPFPLPLPLSFPASFPSLPFPLPLSLLSPAFLTLSQRPAYSVSLNSRAFFIPSSSLYSTKANPLDLPSSFRGKRMLAISPQSVKSFLNVSSATLKDNPPTKTVSSSFRSPLPPLPSLPLPLPLPF